VLFDYINNGILKTMRETCKRQGRPTRGTPTPPGYGYLTHHLPRKVTRARISDSATDEQVLMHKTRGKKTQLYNPTIKMFRTQRPQKTYTYLKQTVPAGSDIGRGRSSTLGVVSTLGRIWPASVGDTGGRISTSKEEASTALGPLMVASSLWTSAKAASSSSGKQYPSLTRSRYMS
jgi:hypothetical protein